MLEEAVPILYASRASVAVDWYRRLGFHQEWEHRAEPGFPAFVSIARGNIRLFLSEHKGDARPDTLLYLHVADVSSIAKAVGVEVKGQPWAYEIELRDPDGNRLRVGTPKTHSTSSDHSPVFLKVIEAVQVAIANWAPAEATDSVAVQFKSIHQAFEALLDTREPLTSRAKVLREGFRREFEKIQGLLEGRLSPNVDIPILIHPVVRFLLMLNYDYAKQNAGAPAARAELVALCKSLTRGSRGAPRKLTSDQLAEAKRLLDSGRTYAEIAKELHLSRVQVRTALLHHFPDEEKSPSTFRSEKK